MEAPNTTLGSLVPNAALAGKIHLMHTSSDSGQREHIQSEMVELGKCLESEDAVAEQVTRTKAKN